MKLFQKTFCLFVFATLSQLSFSETLLEIYEQALDNDPQLRAAKAAYEANKEAYKIGRSALLPNITASAGYSDASRDFENTGAQIVGGVLIPSPDSQNSSDVTTTNYGATLRQPLFDMNKWYSYKQGAMQTEQAEAQFTSDQRAMMIRVADVYLNVLRAIDNLETARAQEAALASQLEQQRQRFEVGLTAITDVNDAQSRYDDAVATLLQVEGNVGIQFQAFEVLIGRSPDSLAPIVDNFPVTNPTPANRQEWVDFAIANNSDLKSAEFAKESGRYAAKASKSNHLPTVTGAVNYNHSDGDTDATGSNFPGTSISNAVTDGTSFSITLDVPIYSGGLTSALSRQSTQRYIQAEENYTLTYRNTTQLTRSYHLAVTTGVATVNARRQAIVSAQSSLEATQAGYEVGTRNIVEVLDAQQRLFTAQFQYQNALYQYILDTLRLKEVSGILTPQDIIELNQWLDAQNQITPQSLQLGN